MHGTAINIFINASDECSKAAKSEPSRFSDTRRQVKSSAKKRKIALESVQTEKFSPGERLEAQHTEIYRVLENPDESLGQFHYEDKTQMQQLYKKLTTPTHPNKLTQEKANKAQACKQEILTNDRKLTVN